MGVLLLAVPLEGVYGDQIWVDQNDQNCSDEEGCGSSQTPCCTFEAGVREAGDGDTVKVEPGTYSLVNGFYNLPQHRCEIRSTSGASATTIVGTLQFSYNNTPWLLQGFTVTTDGVEGDNPGIICNTQSPELRDNIITECDDSAIQLMNSEALIIDSVLSSNSGARGGGVHIEDSAGPTVRIVNCVIEDNHATNGAGGGVYALGQGTLWMVACTLRDNTAALTGAAVYANGFPSAGAGAGGDSGPCDYTTNVRTVKMQNCLITCNEAVDSGGALFFNTHSKADIINATITGNECTHEECYGGAIGAKDSCVKVRDCILWDDDAPTGSEIGLDAVADADLTITYSLLEGGCDGISGDTKACSSDNVFAQNPQFVDPDETACTEDDDFRLHEYSPAIDAADNTKVLPDLCDLNGDEDTDEYTPFDLDGNARFVDVPGVPDTGVPDSPDYLEIVDMGAYEFQCESECPEATIYTASPYDGTIDARQPHPIDSTSPRQGIGSEEESEDHIYVFTSPSVTGADSLCCWRFCETGEYPEGPNRITGVTQLYAGIYEIHLERAITAGEWTTLEYVPDESYVTYGFLPADSNGNECAGATDILAHIDCCVNRVCYPPHWGYSCDIDHDGDSDSADTSRLSDLLSGTGEFDPWNGQTLPDNTCPEGAEEDGFGMSPPYVPDPAEVNAQFIVGFVEYLTKSEIVDSQAEAEFREIVEALTAFCLHNFSAEERKTLADKLGDPSLTFASTVAAELAPKIVEALLAQ